MNDLKFRPRFRVDTALDHEEVYRLLKEKVSSDNPLQFGGTGVKGHLILSIPTARRHFWSPQMDISIVPIPEKQATSLRCLMAPAPVVWTMFMFFYALSGFAILVGLMIGSSQYSLNKEPWGFYIVGGALLLWLVLFVLVRMGQKLAKQEMNELKAFVLGISWPPIPHSSLP